MLYMASSGGRIHVFVALESFVLMVIDRYCSIDSTHKDNCKLLFCPSATRNTKDEKILVRGSDSVGAFFSFFFF